MKILITGTAGFVGFHLVEKLSTGHFDIVGIDNINDYYDPALKFGRLKAAGIEKAEIVWQTEVKSTLHGNYRFVRMNLEDKNALMDLCEREQFDVIVHLAAQAGVRYSITNPDAYAQSNLVGFLNVLEVSRQHRVKHLVYASSSSVYGLNSHMPFSVHNNVDHPVSLYAATKKANELMAHAYSHLYRLPTTGLRFFTVYGPWGRPDMAYFLFADAISKGRPIKVFNHGKMKRDFTYIDDIVEGLVSIINHPAKPDSSWDPISPDPSSSSAPYRVFNIGNNCPVELMEFIREIENSLGKEALIEYQEMQAGDVVETWADVSELEYEFNYKPNTAIAEGLAKFSGWYKTYHGLL
jgi:UDP-glucuronate 4-epimerase